MNVIAKQFASMEGDRQVGMFTTHSPFDWLEVASPTDSSMQGWKFLFDVHYCLICTGSKNVYHQDDMTFIYQVKDF